MLPAFRKVSYASPGNRRRAPRTLILILFALLDLRLLLARLPARLETADLVIRDPVVRFACSDGRRLAWKPELGPARRHLIVNLLAQRGALGKHWQMAVLLTGIDECLRAVGPLLRRGLCRIQPGAPRVAQDVDVIDRIAAARHRPDHLVHVGWVDVFVHRDDPFGVIGAARHLRRQRQHLRRVARIALLKADYRHTEAAGSGRMGIHTGDAWNAELVEIVPDLRRADDREEAALLARGIICHQRIGEDRSRAVVHRGDIDERAAGFRPAVVAGKFAERPFRLHRVEADLALNDQLGVGGNQQVGLFAADHLDRFALDAAGVFILGNIFREGLRADQHEQRIDAPGGCDLDRLALLPGAGDVQARVLAGRQVEADL